MKSLCQHLISFPASTNESSRGWHCCEPPLHYGDFTGEKNKKGRKVGGMKINIIYHQPDTFSGDSFFLSHTPTFLVTLVKTPFLCDCWFPFILIRKRRKFLKKSPNVLHRIIFLICILFHFPFYLQQQLQIHIFWVPWSKCRLQILRTHGHFHSNNSKGSAGTAHSHCFIPRLPHCFLIWASLTLEKRLTILDVFRNEFTQAWATGSS